MVIFNHQINQTGGTVMENTIKMLIAEDSAEFADVGTAVYEEFGVSPSFLRERRNSSS